MIRRFLWTLLLGLSVAACSRAGDVPPTAKSDLEKLAGALPSLYWYASDACLRETTTTGLGQLEAHDKFVGEQRAEIEKIEAVNSLGGQVIKGRLRLFEPGFQAHQTDEYGKEVPEEHWVFEFVYRDGAWQPDTAVKFIGKDSPGSLYEDTTFLGRKVMGSMEPYMAKALDAFAHGKDLAVVFPRPPKR